MKNSLSCFATIVFILSICTITQAVEEAEIPLLNLTEFKDDSSIEANQDKLVTVKLSGKVSHVGDCSYHAIVPGVHIWLAEYPSSKQLNVTSDEKGWWAMKILKHKGTKLKFSLIYVKDDWVTTKSNVLTVTDHDDTDIAIQYIDPVFFRLLVKPFIENMMKSLNPPDADITFKNAVVVTVGKSWASIHDDRLPHGDPDATVNAISGAVGPIYFDKQVKPNPSLTCTSVDGGVAWLNVPEGTHVIKTTKKDVQYLEVEFVINAENDVVLYIASPPDSVQGSNDSAPGQD